MTNTVNDDPKSSQQKLLLADNQNLKHMDEERLHCHMDKLLERQQKYIWQYVNS